MENHEIIAKSKTTNLKIKVSYTDKHITKGTVLIGDAFNKVGAFDYWSTSTLTFEEMKKIKAVCINNSTMSFQDDFTIGKTYKVKQCEDGLYELKDNDDCLWVICENDFNHNFKIVKSDPIVKQVTDKFKQRSKVGIEKYGTTLAENNTDDFLTHLEEEMMDSLLYIQKLKSQSDTLLQAKHNELIQQFDKLKKEQLEYFSEVELINHLGKKGYSITIKREL